MKYNLEKLCQFGVAKVNITPAESSAFYFDKWVPLDRFIEWFPGDLNQALTSHRYGDVFVRNDLISNSNQITWGEVEDTLTSKGLEAQRVR